MSLSREKIVEELVKICGEEAVVTDIEVLQEVLMTDSGNMKGTIRCLPTPFRQQWFL